MSDAVNALTISRVKVPATADLVSIIRDVGATTEQAVYSNGWLTVRGVSQEALDRAAQPADAMFALRQGVKVQAQQELRRRINAGLPFRGKVADMDEERSIPRINGAVTGALLAQQQGTPFLIEWRMADNSFIELDAPSLITLGQLVLSYFQALNAHYWTLVDRIMSAPDEAALAAIDPLAGWPEPPVEPPPAA